MWRIEEHRRVDRQLSGRVPQEVLKRYEKWKDIAMLSGPPGLRAIKGFHDEALSGEWKGHRSSRLGLQWRGVFWGFAHNFFFLGILINPPDHLRPRDGRDFPPPKKGLGVFRRMFSGSF